MIRTGRVLISPFSVIAGMWLAQTLHKPFWTWAPIYGFAVLLAVHLCIALAIVVRSWWRWRGIEETSDND